MKNKWTVEAFLEKILPVAMNKSNSKSALQLELGGAALDVYNEGFYDGQEDAVKENDKHSFNRGYNEGYGKGSEEEKKMLRDDLLKVAEALDVKGEKPIANRIRGFITKIQ